MKNRKGQWEFSAKLRMLNIEVFARGLMELTMQVYRPACARESEPTPALQTHSKNLITVECLRELPEEGGRERGREGIIPRSAMVLLHVRELYMVIYFGKFSNTLLSFLSSIPFDRVIPFS